MISPGGHVEGSTFADAQNADVASLTKRQLSQDPTEAIEIATSRVLKDASDTDALLERASAYVARGDEAAGSDASQASDLYRHALADFNAVVRLEPMGARALLARAATHARLGQWQAARADSDAALSLEPPLADARWMRGLCNESLGLYTDALADYDAAVTTKPTFVVAHVSRARILTLLERYGTALEAYARVIDIAPDYVEAYIGRGSIYGFLGDRHTAAGEPAEAKSAYESALADFERVAGRLQPNLAQAHLDRGRALVRLERFEEAFAAFERAVETDPRNPAIYISRGIARELRRDFSGALEDYDFAIKLAPGDPVAYRNRGDAHAALDEFEAALNDYTRAIKLQPNAAAPTYRSRAGLHLRRNDFGAAIADYTRALDLEPDLETLQLRAVANEAAGDVVAALGDYKKAINHAPSVGLLCERAELYERQGSHEAAADDYSKALKIDPRSIQALLGKARTSAAEGDYRDAIKDISRVLDLDPEFGDGYLIRASFRHALGHNKEALSDCEAAIRLDPTDSTAFAARADIHRVIGRAKAAIADYTRALKFDPGLVAVYESRAAAYAETGDYERAQRDWDAVIAFLPESADARVGRADTQLARGDYERAAWDYDYALELDASHRRALYGQIRVLILIGHMHAEMGRPGKMRESYEAALESCGKAEELGLEDAWVGGSRATALRCLGAYDRAVNAVAKALSHSDASHYSLWLENERGEALLLWGETLRLDEKLNEAVIAFEGAAAAANAPEEKAAILERKGHALALLHLDDDALACFREAISRDGKLTGARIGIGKVARRAGEAGEAQVAFESVVSMDSADVDARRFALIGRGLVLEKLGQSKEAERDWDAALGDASARAYLDRAGMFLYFEAENRARKDMEAALKLEPDQPMALNALAWFHAERPTSREQLERMRDNAYKAVQLEAGGPNRFSYLDTLGWLLYRLDEGGKAEEALEEAFNLNKHPVDVRARLAAVQTHTVPGPALAKGADMTNDIVANGIDATTGQYITPTLSLAQVARVARGEDPDPALARWLRRVWRIVSEPHLGLPPGVDPANVADAGWAVVFDDSATQEIRDALVPLIEHRRLLTDDSRTRILDYHNGESPREWLTRHGVAAGTVDPTKVPYYVLLIGPPTAIPFRFQYLLDVEYAVGRLAFDTADEYSTYATSVVAYETTNHDERRTVAFFGTRHVGDRATILSADDLVRPLADGLQTSKISFVGDDAGAEATKANLLSLFRKDGKDRPAVVFTATHGLGCPAGDTDQTLRQGALLCQDWQWGTPPTDAEYFTGDDVPADASVEALIAFHFACYSAGTPAFDDFAHQTGSAAQIAPEPFVSSLAKALLGHSRGSALAVVGHVERAWGYSIETPGAGAQIQPFHNALSTMLAGRPVGYAMKDFNERYAALSTNLSALLEEVDAGADVSDQELASLWTERNDAQNYIVLGDPAAGLRVSAPAN
jgi:tetratricopeptide (TPR) repeat protein